jgi:outer membrane autotransporter protein
VTVDASTPVNSYKVTREGTLNIVDGGVVDTAAISQSTLNMNNGSINGGVLLEGSRAKIEQSLIRNNSGHAIRVGFGNFDVSFERVTDIASSSVFGIGAGVNLGARGVLNLSGTSVFGADSSADGGRGINVLGADLRVSNRSYIRGDLYGLKIMYADSDGSGGPVVGKAESSLVLDDSTVQGVRGAAIRVDEKSVTGASTVADITVQNHSTLLAGNGNLLEVADHSIATFKVDNSALNGNLVADDTSTLNVTLQRNAQLTGNIINSNTLAINSGASWTMVDDNQVNSLAMRGGRVSFGEGAFKTLILNELSGRGTFDMRVNLDNAQGDLLRVAGQASGNHRLNVKNTGVDVVDPDMSPLLIVDTDGGDARFSLAGERADLGVYSYELEQQGDDWFIIGSGKAISPSTQSVLALFNAAPNIWNSELTTLRSRMGEVRGQEQGGSWMRAYGSRFNASTGDGVDYRNNQSGVSLGADTPFPVGVGQLSLGLMAGYSKNDLAIGEGTSGKIDSYYVGGYGTWLLDDGYYVDALLKLNRFRNESKVAMSDGAKAKGDYDSTGIGGSIEAGKHIKLADGYFVEPYAQLSTVWIDGDRYALDNGMQASNYRTQSVLGKVGAAAGRSINLKDGGVLKPYLRAAFAQEFSRSNEVKVNTTRFNNELFGSRAEVGAGVSVSLSERLQLHADFDYMKGKHVEQPWGANVGLKLAF